MMLAIGVVKGGCRMEAGKDKRSFELGDWVTR